MTRVILAAGVVLTLAASSPALAQGKSQQAKTPAPPSRTDLTITPAGISPTSATPLAWVDDASVLAPGMVAVSISAMRWQGSGLSEVNAPIIDGAFGLMPRLQLSASIPRVLGSADPVGAQGGVGTSFFSAKIAVYEMPERAFKIAVAPTLQLLGGGVVESLGVAQSRVRWGLPVSAELSRGTTRIYGGGGYFSPGLWFGGAAVGFSLNPKTNASIGVSRAWRATETLDVPMSERDRKELSAGASYAVRTAISLFGSIGRTFLTLDENGAGTSLSCGIAIFFATPTHRP